MKEIPENTSPDQYGLMPKAKAKYRMRNEKFLKRVILEDNPTLQGIVKNLAKAGCSDKEIAKIIGISEKNLVKKMRQLPEIEASVLEGRSQATQNVVAALYRSAMGGEKYTEVIEKTTPRGTTTTKIHKSSPKSVPAMIFYLTNRDPENWLPKSELDKGRRRKEVPIDVINDFTKLIDQISVDDTEPAQGEPALPEEIALGTPRRLPSAADIPGDVCGETGDSVQDIILDVSAEERTVDLQTPSV